MSTSLLTHLAPLSAEIIVAVGAMALLMWGVVRDPGTLQAAYAEVATAGKSGGRKTARGGKHRRETRDRSRIITWAAILVLLVTAADIAIQHDLKEAAFSGAFLVDPVARFAKINAQFLVKHSRKVDAIVGLTDLSCEFHCGAAW